MATGPAERAQFVPGPRGVLHRAADMAAVPAVEGPLGPDEVQRKAVADRLDVERLLAAPRMVTDQDERMLIPRDAIAGMVGAEVHIARVPPRIEFAMVPATPHYFQAPRPGEGAPLWTNWSQANYYGPTGRFYSSVGDHVGYNAHMYIVEYDPATQRLRCLPEINRILGRRADEFGDGKIHGWLDFFDGPNLWFCTYWCKYPEPNEADFASGYEGGHIMSLDVLSGDVVDYGVPLKRASWPYHRVDTRRGIMYAVGMFGEFLAWDIQRQEKLWAGYLPDGMEWWVRAYLIDAETGLVYTSNAHKGDRQRHLLRYDPERNRFSMLEAHMPPSPGRDASDHLRANTRDRGPDGLYYGITYTGQMLTFDPVTETVQDKGRCWVGSQQYTAAIERSPGGRYLYYCPGAHGSGFMEGTPIVQYDTCTGQRKVLAFLFPYYTEKYGYTVGGTFSIKLDPAGERLFILWNGAFIDVATQVQKERVDVFGQNAVMMVHIPAAERQE